MAGAKTQVQLRFAAGVTPTAPAGVTLTAVSGQSATGYLTPASGHAFAQALRDAIKADLAAGKPAGTGTLFGGLTSMAVLGASTPVQPHYPLHILQVNTLDDTGAPTSLPVILVDLDNPAAFTGQVFSYQGVARVAVPAGNYAAIAINFAFDPAANTQKVEIATPDGIVVPDTGTVPPATVDMRTATSPVKVTTQRPSTLAGSLTSVARSNASGTFSATLSVDAGADTTVLLAPAPKPAVGSLTLTENWIANGPDTARDPYRYNVVLTSDHIDANQSYAPADSTLATQRHKAVLDPVYGTNQALLGSGHVSNGGYALLGLPIPAGGLTEYVTGGLQWTSELMLPQIPNSQNFSFAFLDDDIRTLAAGQSVARTWGQAPLVGNFGQHPATTLNLYGCQACVSGTTVAALLGMLGDSNKDTTGLDFTAAGTAQLYWNGQLVSSDTNRLGYVVQNVPAGPAKMRMVLDFDRTATGVVQSAKTHTDVTIPIPGKSNPALTLPAGTYCPAAADPTATCQVLPALTLNYQFNALSDTNTSHSPRQNLVLRVGHLSYGGVGSTAHIASVRVAVSFDQGATWQDVATHGGDGNYDAHWSNPAPGSHVALRVTATDCLGGSITQTVTDPYTVG
ncbi:hypothetical protein ACFQ9X_27570 [Catenulispora yoronensis]